MFVLEKDMKGGVSYISKRYSKASKKHLKSYDPKQENIIYIKTLFTWMQIINMVMLGLNFFEQVYSNG